MIASGGIMNSSFFFALAILSVLWGIVSSIVIVSYLSNRGVKISFIFFRIMILKYIHQYYTITKEENGKPGPWFYSYIIAMNAALVLAIVGAILR
jgi:hypothetical protein